MEHGEDVIDGSLLGTDATSTEASASSSLSTLCNSRENARCADCGDDASTPTWAVLPFGSLVCIQCSGIHRSLGTHISKVRSISLDSWTAEMAQLMAQLGIFGSEIA